MYITSHARVHPPHPAAGPLLRAAAPYLSAIPSMAILVVGLVFAIGAGARDAALAASIEEAARRTWVLSLEPPAALGYTRAFAQLCFIAGAIGLLIAPILERNRMLMVLQGFLATSALLYFLAVPTPVMLILRLTLSVGVLCLLSRMGELAGFQAANLLRPRYYLRVLAGREGSGAAGALGIELLGVGYVTGLAAFMLAGSLFLMRFAQLGHRETGQGILRVWIALNAIYAVSSATLLGQQLGWL